MNEQNNVAQPAVVVTLTRTLGAYGAAFDLPGPHRAFTYHHQPGNIGAHRLGAAWQKAASGSSGDLIDRGLGLLKALQEVGFGVFEVSEIAAPADEQNVLCCDAVMGFRRSGAAFPAHPLPVFSAGKWTYDGTGQAFDYKDLDEAAFSVYRAALASAPVASARAALAQLEAACDTLCRLRTQEQYLSMVDSGQQDALLALDDARAQARAALASAPVAKPSPEHFKPPFDNCSFRMCDLPGQCRGEGKCHHPASAPVAGDADALRQRITALITFDQLADVHGEEATAKWIAGRQAAAPQASETGARAACLRRQRNGSEWGHWIPGTVEDGERVTGLRSWQVRWLVDAAPQASEAVRDAARWRAYAAQFPELSAAFLAMHGDDPLPTIKGATITGGYVVVTPAGWGADKATKLRDAIHRVFPVNTAYMPPPSAALSATQAGQGERDA